MSITSRAGAPGALLATLMAACLGAGPELLVAQEGAGLFFDTVEVRVVNVEVLVTDKEGLPVTDLTPADFEVLEDGEPVPVSNFFAVEGRQVKAQDGAAGAPTPESLFFGPETRRLNLILFVDNLNMRPRNRNVVFDNVETYLRERLDPRDRVMIVGLGRQIEVVQPFTNDPGLLLRAIDELEMRSGDFLRLETEQRGILREIQQATLPANPLTQGGGGALATESWEAAQQRADRIARDIERLAEVRIQRVRATVEALAEFSDTLAGMKGRKAVLYVSDGLPLRPADAPAQAWLNKFEDWIQAQNAQEARRALQDMTRVLGGPRYDASSYFDRLVDRASANGVVFYPLSNARAVGATGVSAEFQAAGTTTGRGAYSSDVLALETTSLESSLLQMAHGTGGVAFTRTPNVGGLLEEVARDFDTFYSLGFEPRDTDGDVHEVEVKVKRKGLVVRHLGAHRQRDPIEYLTELTLSALQFGLEDNALDVELEPGAATPSEGKRYRLQVMVKVPFRNVLLLPQDEQHVGKLTLIVAVRDEGGGLSKPLQIDLPLAIPNAHVAQVAQQYAAYPLQLDLTRGRKRIAIGVRDELARIDATVNLEVAVGAEGPAAAESAVGR